MSKGCSDHFSEIGGNCSKAVLTIFQKLEEIVQRSFRPFFRKGRKLSIGYSDLFSETGGNCLKGVMTIIQKQEEIVY